MAKSRRQRYEASLAVSASASSILVGDLQKAIEKALAVAMRLQKVNPSVSKKIVNLLTDAQGYSHDIED